MADDAKLYRERADAERTIADTCTLINVRDRSLRAADKWDQLADRAERSQSAAIGRADAKAGINPMPGNPVT